MEAHYVGIDVGKDTLHIAQDVLGGKALLRNISNTEEAIKSLIGSLPERAHCIFEATGAYHLCLAYLLRDAGVPFSILNPIASKGFASSLLSEAKTDSRDAQMLLRFGKERMPDAARMPDREWQQTRQELAEWQYCIQSLGQEQNRLHSLKAWSGSSPKAIGMAETRIALLKGQIAQMEEDFKKQMPEGMDEPMRLAKTIKGIGHKTALYLLFFTEGLESFESPEKLAKFIGLAPMVKQSGKFKGRGSVSKRGNSMLRGLLYNCAKSAKRFNPACKELYQRLKAKGKAHKICMVAVAHKLLRQFFAVVKGKTAFDPNIA